MYYNPKSMAYLLQIYYNCTNVHKCTLQCIWYTDAQCITHMYCIRYYNNKFTQMYCRGIHHWPAPLSATWHLPITVAIIVIIIIIKASSKHHQSIIIIIIIIVVIIIFIIIVIIIVVIIIIIIIIKPFDIQGSAVTIIVSSSSRSMALSGLSFPPSLVSFPSLLSSFSPSWHHHHPSHHRHFRSHHQHHFHRSQWQL